MRKELKNQTTKLEKQDTEIRGLEIKVTKMESENTGALAVIDQKIDSLKDMLDIVVKRLPNKG